MKRNLRSRANRAGITSLAAIVALLAGSAAKAASPQPVSGDFVVEDLAVTSVEPVGEVTLIDLTAAFRLDGDLDGLFVADFAIVHFGAPDEPADQVFIAHGTFDGEVVGAVGSFDFTFVGEITADGFAEGDLVIDRGFDELANLSGQLTLSGIAGVEGTYEGTVHFAD